MQSLHITPEFLRLIAEMDAFNARWQVGVNQSPERLQVLRRVASIESIGSSTRVEGSQLRNDEVEKLLSQVGKTSFESRDEQEVAGYAEAMETVFSHYEHIPLTENYLKQLHATLLRHSEKDERHRGDYKKLNNHVEAFAPDGTSLGVVFATSSPFETPEAMRGLMRWTEETLRDRAYHPLVVTAIFNVVFLAIHPFQDGNGRLSRVLISLLMLKAGYSYIPYSSLESIIEKNKEAYYLALQQTQRTLKSESVDWLPWMGFFLNALKRQKDHLIEKTQSLPAASNDTDLPVESALIMQHVGIHHRITLAQAQQIIHSISRPTIKNRLAQLVQQGRLIRHGKARGTWYSKPD